MANDKLFIISLLDTLAKKSTEQSTNLKKNQILPFPRGKIYPVETWEAIGDHIKVTLGYKAGTWYFYEPHVEIKDDRGTVLGKQFILINTVPSQTKTLSPQDYANGAALLGCSVAALKAIVAVESAGGGFLPSGKPKILFEAHWFAHFTDNRYNAKYPNLSSTYWNRSLYQGGEKEWWRLEKAVALNHNAAICSASWGLFQVMGFHWKLAYPTVNEFHRAMCASEWEQLKIAIAFIKNKKLDRHLRNKSWNAFAYGYNGSGYRANAYHAKLAQAYERFA